MVAATKAVSSTLLLLFITMFVVGIIFKQGIGSNNPDFYGDFGSLIMSMYTLFSRGTVLDDVKGTLYALRASSEGMAMVR
jgi:hypothetical protein